eukprot:TRINITY_DN19590_c0_g1_i3.p1 TRINITY_DN19590_c0_g1~~TRINITY_DN19590_c0_g1_i3.p1  ORF type:complete len:163 (+),score=34.56 TRINITY_DN19590_c0_g1_i3:28-516(+)
MLQRARLSVVLVCPEIPGNTGNIARSCAAAQVPLHLVKPLGFSIEDKALKRAGLDYWGKMQICEHNRLEDFLESTMGRDKGSRRLIGFSKHGTMAHTDLQYRHGDLLMFGSETRGLPPAAHHACAVSYTHLRAHETPEHLVCRLLLEKKKKIHTPHSHISNY